jgi:hypothetical protein
MLGAQLLRFWINIQNKNYLQKQKAFLHGQVMVYHFKSTVDGKLVFWFYTKRKVVRSCIPSRCPTRRAVDRWVRAAFLSVFAPSSFSRFDGGSQPSHLPLTRAVGRPHRVKW